MSSEDIQTEINFVASNLNQFILNNISGEPSGLYTASLHYIKSGGKRLRPFMAIKSSELFNGSLESSLPAAALATPAVVPSAPAMPREVRRPFAQGSHGRLRSTPHQVLRCPTYDRGTASGAGRRAATLDQQLGKNAKAQETAG